MSDSANADNVHSSILAGEVINHTGGKLAGKRTLTEKRQSLKWSYYSSFCYLKSFIKV